MKRFSVFSALIFLIVCVLGIASALGQTPDSAFVVAWGYNSFGQCNVPEPKADFVAVAGGGWHSLGLKSDGTIMAWGSNDDGQCTVPEPNTDFAAVAAGGAHNLGLKSDGTIAAWGYNDYGQCDIPAPNADFVSVAAGLHHSVGLKSDGTIVAWGWNDNGQCIVPEPNSGFVAIRCGWQHSLGLKSDGSIVAWGSNSAGQCTVPAPNADFVAVAGGGAFSMGLKTNGSITAWGWNGDGQCDVPEFNVNFSAIAAGWYHSLGLKNNGTIVAWGNNDDGQCVVPEPNTDFVAVAAGGCHSLGLKSCPAVAVAFSSFSARAQEGAIVLRWETVADAAISGYLIYRAEHAGEFACITGGALSPNERSYEDTSIETGREYRYQVAALTPNGGEIRSHEANASVSAPPLALEQNIPNPFNPATTIAFSLPQREHVRLDVYDVEGTLVRRLVDEPMKTGQHKVVWDGRDSRGRLVESGVYIYRLIGGKKSSAKKMILLR